MLDPETVVIEEPVCIVLSIEANRIDPPSLGLFVVANQLAEAFRFD